MGAATVLSRQVFPAGDRYWEVIKVSTSAATSVDALLTFTSALRWIQPGGIEWGRLATPSLTSLTGVTYTNATTYPGHATVGISGISTSAAEKIFDLVIVGGM